MHTAHPGVLSMEPMTKVGTELRTEGSEFGDGRRWLMGTLS